jgi:3-phenylpropionate/trans-cinnamate dioxygenase ferredoxin reductase subunit
MSRIVIVGGGQAASQAAATLRQDGFEGEVLVIGDEPQLPYQRPPLSKQYLSGEHPLERIYLRPAKFYDDRKITLRLGTRVTEIDRAAGRIAVDGEHVAYDSLLLATGSRPRRLSCEGATLRGVHYLRTVADVDAIRAALAPGKRIVIVGGGYIGLEVAAVVKTAGADVTVLEMEDRILKRVTTPTMSAFYTAMHEARGVKIVTSTTVARFEGKEALEAVVTADGARFPADLSIVGIGIAPNVELAQAAGLECANGIVVDDHCRTTDPRIFAAGDCTQHPNPLLGRRLRLESVPNAMEQARVAARNMQGKDEVYAAFPWFWSDQYEHKLQMVGFSTDGDQQVVRGDMESKKFAVFYLKAGVVVAVDAVNSPKEFMAGRQLVDKRVVVDVARLADASVDLKSLIG